MFPVNLFALAYALLFAFGLFFAYFLFWRACKHELLDSDLAFDIIFFATFGAFIFGRIFDFFVRWQFYEWSFTKLLLFNYFAGFDLYGAIFGAGLGTFVYLRKKRINLFLAFDLGAAPFLFAQIIVVFSTYLLYANETRSIFAYYLVAYIAIFIALKRLATKKRHSGFFVSFWLFSIGLVDLMFYPLREDVDYIVGGLSWQLLSPAVLTYLSAVFWYKLSKRHLKKDIGDIFGKSFLSLLSFKRAITSANEAGKFCKIIIFLPYSLTIGIWKLVKLFAREVKFGLLDFLYVLGVRKH